MHLLRLMFLLLVAASLEGQTTQGIISGQVRDSLSDEPVPGALVSCTSLDSGLETGVATDTSGAYTLPLLSPGDYSLKVAAASYQPQEIYDLNLAVGGRLAVRFRLRPLSDVWEAGQYQAVIDPDTNHVVRFFGPDVDPNRVASVRANHGESSNLDTSVSDVIDSRLINDLPLLGRDVYSLLVVLPAVTSDTASGRGVNVSVAGQRPSSSNFLLDGVESNNYLVTGPLAALNPEAFQEYRISTNNYSAEYGRSGSFIANAVTHPGTGSWHGSGYVFLKNDVLDANGFQENAGGIPRASLHQVEPGASLTGPVLKDRLFTSVTFDRLGFRSYGDPQDYLLPTQSFADGLPLSSAAGRLLQPLASFLPKALSDSATLTEHPPTALNQTSVVERTDFVTKNGKQRFMLRAALYDSTEPGLGYSPYPGFSADLDQKSSAFAVVWTAALSPAISNELKASRSGMRFTFDRPHSEVPALESVDQVVLPESHSMAGFRDRDATYELLDNLSYARGAHLFRFGGGWLHRDIRSALSNGLQGSYVFLNLQKFAAGIPLDLVLSDGSSTDPSVVPDPNREYTYDQASFFAQDSYQISRRLTLNYGIRYEFFGSPSNTGNVKDSLIQLGPGNSFVDRLAAATFVTPSSGRQQIYSSIAGNWAGRFAFAFDPFQNGRSVLRGSYGLFYDRPFDNYWQSVEGNSVFTGVSIINQPIDFLSPVRQIASMYPASTPLQLPIEPSLFQPNLRAARVQSAFLSFEQRLSGTFSFQLLGIGTFGRDLITTDQINRPYSVPLGAACDCYPADNPNGLINPNLPTYISYRGNQGKSDYLGTSAIVHYRSRLAEGQISYTLSHAIDNQSDPLAGLFQNYSFGNILMSGGSPVLAAFTRQFDSQGDRANADFDQRQNLVSYSVLESPTFSRPLLRKLLGNWHLGSIAAIRSGLPYSVTAPEVGVYGVPVYKNNRVDLITSASAASIDIDIPGGKQLLNPAAFQTPAIGTIGNTGRNAFRGPGLFNVDLSLSREFPISRLGESGRFTVRADFFNVLNHANLNNPCAAYMAVDCGFGDASFGRAEANNGFPLLLPLAETARQIQLLFRVSF